MLTVPSETIAPPTLNTTRVIPKVESGTKPAPAVPQVKVVAETKPPGTAASSGGVKNESILSKPQAPAVTPLFSGPFTFGKPPESNQASAPARANPPDVYAAFQKAPLVGSQSPSKGGLGGSDTSGFPSSSKSTSSYRSPWVED